MTKDAKGRGNAAPPDPIARALDEYRAEYARTGNIIVVWQAIAFLGLFAEFGLSDAKTESSERAFPSPSEPSVTLPFWCWQYLSEAAQRINAFSRLRDHDDKTWDHAKKQISEKLDILGDRVKKLEDKGELSSEISSLLEQIKSANKAVSSADFRRGSVTAMKTAKALPQIFGFVDGAGYNAFYDYWRAEKKKAVAYALEVSEESGMKREEILAAVSEMTGIIDAPTIRRYVKEAKGKALPRRRSNKPKAPKGKKD